MPTPLRYASPIMSKSRSQFDSLSREDQKHILNLCDGQTYDEMTRHRSAGAQRSGDTALDSASEVEVAKD